MDFSLLLKTDRKKHHIILIIVYSFLTIGLVYSTVSEALGKYGIFESIFHDILSDIRRPLLLDASVVFETISIIGFSSLFIGLIYTNLDKSMLGLSYDELLDYNYPFYREFSYYHIIITACCIITSAAKLSESAWISFLIILISFTYQWVIFVKLIGSSTSCEKLAIYCWKKKLDESDNDLVNLQRLAETLPGNDSKFYHNHLICLSYAFYRYTIIHNSPNDLKNVASIWNVIFISANEIEKDLIAKDIFSILISKINSDDNSEKEAVGIIASGYLVKHFCYDVKGHKDINIDKQIKEFYSKTSILLNEICLYGDNYNKTLKDYIINCIKTNLYCMHWVYVLFGEISANRDLLDIIPDKNEDIITTFVEEIITMLNPSSSETIKKHILRVVEISKSQLNYQVQERNS